MLCTVASVVIAALAFVFGDGIYWRIKESVSSSHEAEIVAAVTLTPSVQNEFKTAEPTPSVVVTQTATATPAYTPAPTDTPTPTPHVHVLAVDDQKGKYCIDCGEIIGKWVLANDWTATVLQAGADEKLETKVQSESIYYGINYYWWSDSDLNIHKTAKGLVPSGYSLNATYKTSEINSLGKKDSVYHGITTGRYNAGYEGKSNKKFNVEISDEYYMSKETIPDYYWTYRRETKDVTYYRLWRLQYE